MTLQLCKMDSKYLSHGSFYMLHGVTLSGRPDPVDVHPVSVIFPSSSGRIPVSAFCLSPAPMLSLLSAYHLVTEAIPSPWSRGRSICYVNGSSGPAVVCDGKREQNISIFCSKKELAFRSGGSNELEMSPLIQLCNYWLIFGLGTPKHNILWREV